MTFLLRDRDEQMITTRRKILDLIDMAYKKLCEGNFTAERLHERPQPFQLVNCLGGPVASLEISVLGTAGCPGA
jgi:hypothetical protein